MSNERQSPLAGVDCGTTDQSQEDGKGVSIDAQADGLCQTAERAVEAVYGVIENMT